MIFNSLKFLLFFIIITLTYFSIKHKYRWIVLLIGSYYFYMSWKPEYIILIIISTLHGANWTFVIWGLVHGLYMILSNLTKKLRDKIFNYKFRDYVGILITFSFVCFAWIFFRANNLTDAIYIVTHLFIDLNCLIWIKEYGITKVELIVSIFYIFFLVIAETISIERIKNQLLRWLIYLFVIWSILIFRVAEQINFIYFQF